MIDAGAQFGSNSALPAVSLSGAGMTVISGLYNHGTDNRSANWVRIHKNPTTPAAAMSPAQAYAIDSKIDDGISGMGSFRTDQAANCGTAAAIIQDYAFTNNNILCMAAVDIAP